MKFECVGRKRNTDTRWVTWTQELLTTIETQMGGKVGNTAVGVKDKFVIFFKFGEFKNHLVKICPRKFFST